MTMTRNALGQPLSNSLQSYKSEDECHKKYRGILYYCFFSLSKSKSVMLNMVILKVEQMTDSSGILHSLGRSYPPVSSDIIIHLERKLHLRLRCNIHDLPVPNVH